MSYRSDPTANQALGAINREWEELSRLAEQIRKDPNSEWALRAKRRFRGIFKRLLDDPKLSGKAKAS